jgi:hypothetical protein
MKEQFIDRKFHIKSDRIIEEANLIIAEYTAQGYTLTLRQLYYQFVSRDLIKNTMQEYKNLASIINDARLAGEIDWDAIEDRTRNLMSIEHYEDASSFLAIQARRYAEELWADQPYYCEVWVEKDALVGVVERPCNRLRVPFFAGRGYVSQSEMYHAGKRFEEKIQSGKQVVIFHLGDHDPSGIDMTRDNIDRLTLFSGYPIDVRRLALNRDQISQYRPPPNPAKLTDTRAKDYIRNFGDSSWELDALDPGVIDAIVSAHIEGLIDKPLMTAGATKERAEQVNIGLIAKHYDKAVGAVKKGV